jgi:RimJ/RimL family protein N-acetyltransferase
MPRSVPDSTERDACCPDVTPIEIELSGGHLLTVREVTDDDVVGIHELYRNLSSEDSYRRFFSVVKVTEEFVRDWVDRCRESGVGLVAVVDDGAPKGGVVAEAAYVRLPNGNGEFAITVARERRGWLGPFLLDLLLELAAARGVPNLEADILTENRVMLSLARRRGYVTDGSMDFSIVHVVIGTTAAGPVWTGPSRGRRLLVEQPGGRWEGRRDAVRAGFAVMACGFRGERCPALQGGACPLAEEADAIVVAFPRGDARGQALMEAHRELHGRVPVLLPVPSVGHHGPSACRLVSGRPSPELRARLQEAWDADDLFKDA